MIIGISGYATAGKDTVAQILVEQFGFQRLAFADSIRDICLVINPYLSDGLRVGDLVKDYGWDVAKQNTEVRRLLQVLGTEVGRQIFDEDVWVDALFQKVDPNKKYVITDVRFANEAECIKEYGEVWRVNRAGVDPINEHISETQLDDYEFDYVINNDGTFDDLKNKVIKYIEENNAK